MPRIDESSQPPEEPRKRSIAERLGFPEVRPQRFADGFARSRKGNLWRTWEGKTVTVFAREDGGFAWCIADDEGQLQYSSWVYEDEQEAIIGLEIVFEIED